MDSGARLVARGIASRLHGLRQQALSFLERLEDGGQGLRAARIRLDVLARIAAGLSLGDDFEATLQSTFDIVAAQLVDMPLASYALAHDAGGQFLTLHASRGFDEAQEAIVRRREIGASLSGAVVLRRQSVVIEDVDQDRSELTRIGRRFGLRAVAGFPLMAGEQVLGTLTIGSRHASTFDADALTLMQVAAGQIAGALERQRLARLARSGEARLRLALDVGGLGAWSWNWTSDVLDPDAQFLRLHGADTIGDRSMLLARVHIADRAMVADALGACARNTATLRCDYRVVLPGGAVRLLTMRGAPVPHADGSSVTSLVGVALDITATLASQDGLPPGIAHGSGNLVRAVQDLATRRPHRASTDPETRRHTRRPSTNAGPRDAAAPDRLLAFGKRIPLRAAALDPLSLLGGLAEMLAPTLGAHVALEVDCPPGLPKLLADRGRLEAVLVTLAHDARDAMPRGGRLILAADLAPPIDDGAPARGCSLRLRVIGEGDGMLTEVAAGAAAPFFATQRTGKDSSAALAMARGFTERSDGTFAAASTPGLRMAVTLLFPAAAR